MFKRITIGLLAATAMFSGVVAKEATSQTSEPAPAAAASVSVPPDLKLAPDVTEQDLAEIFAEKSSSRDAAIAASKTHIPRFTEADYANVQNAPVYTKCVKPGQVTLTFDDGPNSDPEATAKILEFLASKNITATFFVNGFNWSVLDEDPNAVNLIKQAYQAGHTIGSHTYYHQDLFTSLKIGILEVNLDKMTDKIQEIIGQKPAFFRPPCGKGGYEETQPREIAYNNKVQKYLAASGYSVIMWGADTRDWENLSNVEACINELNKDMLKGSPATDSYIILMHDVYNTTANLVLPKVVDYIGGLGYQFVSLPECLGVPSGYQVEQLQKSIVQANDTSNLTAQSDAISAASIKIIYSAIAVILSVLFFY